MHPAESKMPGHRGGWALPKSELPNRRATGVSSGEAISRGGTEMKHFIGFVLATLLALAPAFAQAPKGWKLRSDHSSDASDPDAPGSNKFMVSGSGFNAVNPIAGFYWNPYFTATGNS